MKPYFNTARNIALSAIILVSQLNSAKQNAIVPSITNHNMKPDTFNMVTTRVFNAPLAQVWKAWSTEEFVKQWWGPKGFTCPLAKMDFKEGRVSLVCMRAPKEYGGQDMYNSWNYQKIEPMSRIEYILNFTDKDGNKLDPSLIGMPPGIPKNVPHVIAFKDLGNNQTEVTVTEHGYTTAQVVELSRSGMNECLDKMAEALGKNK